MWVPKVHWFRCYSVALSLLFSEENKSHMCGFQDWQLSLSWSESNWLDLSNAKENTLVDLLEAKSHWRKMGLSSCILLSLSIHVFYYKNGTTKKKSSDCILKLESKVKLQSSLHFHACQVIAKGQCWMKTSAIGVHHCLTTEMELDAHQTAALGKARENISKHVRFQWHTHHHLKLRNR